MVFWHTGVGVKGNGLAPTADIATADGAHLHFVSCTEIEVVEGEGIGRGADDVSLVAVEANLPDAGVV